MKSPIVGTFYAAPAPNAPPFAKVGDVVQLGQVLCIIEAMKLMNELESEVAGEIVRIYVESGQPVEYGQSLFAIKPSRRSDETKLENGNWKIEMKLEMMPAGTRRSWSRVQFPFSSFHFRFSSFDFRVPCSRRS